ncbi:MAG: SDR family NAD(P)-dependent oxidoreductase [Sarcina sp.]
MRLQNKVILLTDVTLEKGYKLSKLLLENGAKLAFTTTKAEEGAAIVKKLKEELGSITDVIYIPCDFNDTQSVKFVAHEIIDNFGRVDVLINSLEGYIKETKIMLTRENEKKLIEATKYIAELMVEQGCGNIVNSIYEVELDEKANFDLKEYVENTASVLAINNIRINTVIRNAECSNKESILMLISDGSKAMDNLIIE